MRYSRLLNLLTLLFMASIPALVGGQNPPAPARKLEIAARVMEVHNDATTGATVAIFHQADARDRDTMSDFLRIHADGNVQFRTADGLTRMARVFRLGSCFGRGLLVFPAPAARLRPQDKIFLQP